jgi:hypothetical protein
VTENPSDALYKEHLAALKGSPVNTGEPANGHIPMATFFESIAGMGERARKNGTIARMVRTRKND